MNSLKKIISGVLIGVTLTLSVSVYAGNRSIDVLFDNIKIFINGKKIQTDVEPLIYEGRTYVPVRNVAESLNMKVQYNENTNSVDLFSKPLDADDVRYYTLKLDDIHQLQSFAEMLNDFDKTLKIIYYEISLGKVDDSKKTQLEFSMLSNDFQIYQAVYGNQYPEIIENYKKALNYFNAASGTLGKWRSEGYTSDKKDYYYNQSLEEQKSADDLLLKTRVELGKMYKEYLDKFKN